MVGYGRCFSTEAPFKLLSPKHPTKFCNFFAYLYMQDLPIKMVAYGRCCRTEAPLKLLSPTIPQSFVSSCILVHAGSAHQVGRIQALMPAFCSCIKQLHTCCICLHAYACRTCPSRWSRTAAASGRRRVQQARPARGCTGCTSSPRCVQFGCYVMLGWHLTHRLHCFAVPGCHTDSRLRAVQGAPVHQGAVL
jgi:hypothetical protein